MAVVQRPERESAHGWYSLEQDHVLAVLDSSAAHGLSDDEARIRLAQFGPNTIAAAARRSALRLFASQFSDVMVLVLAGAAVLAGFLGEPQDVAAIVTILALNAILGFVQEFRAERAVAALRSMAALTAVVRRNGGDARVPAAELVPGDIAYLEAGNVVPADLRLIETPGIAIDESSLTGESLPVEKTASPIAARDLPVADRRNMAYSGSVVTRGRARGVVVATGMRTELGRIAAMLDQAEDGQTPLQARLARFGRTIALVVFALCAVIFAAGVLRGEPAPLMFMTALSLAVAAIPEALPAVVTVALALGARKMARHHALIRRLSAVETLGSVTFICTDKTGTLTQNEMRVEVMRPADGMMLDAIALNGDVRRGADGDLTGDPTELALYRAATDAGRAPTELAERYPRVAEVPFSSDAARMTTVHRDGRGVIAFTKGAPERVVPNCVNRLADGAETALDVPVVLEQAREMAGSGLRVLAVSMRRASSLPEDVSDLEAAQTFVGLVGLLDPPRAEAYDAVAMCKAAGIHVVMVTGDHPATARAVAERLDIAPPGAVVITGAQLASMSSEELDACVRDVRVYARVAPEDKIRIVKALQRRGEYVAMTGDGVNDSPALKRADIGVAFGRGGTDVAREAAHMVLLDDNFATIANAVREGRRVYDNIRRFVRYTLSTNSGEIWTLFLAPFVGLPLPLLPIHILWMNLVTDGLPGLALTAERAERDVMRRPPRPAGESIFALGLWQHSLWIGLLMAALTLGTQAWSLHSAGTHWRTMAFTVLTLSQLAHITAIRSERESLLERGLGTNRPLLGAVVLTVALQLATIYVPPLARVFKTVPLTAPELGACLGVSSLVFFAAEGEKWVRRRRNA